MANSNASRQFLQAVYNKKRIVRLENCTVGSFDRIFSDAVQQDPRIVAYIDLDKLSYSYSKNSIISLSEDYEINIEYQSQFSSIDEIIRITSNQDIRTLIESRKTDDIWIIGEHIDDFDKSLDSLYVKYLDTLEGFDNIYWTSMTYEKYTILNVQVKFLVEKNVFAGYQKKVDFETKQIIASMKNLSRVPVFLKVFLAFSYVSQSIRLNRQAQEERIRDNSPTSFPLAHIAYGALTEKKASSRGISWTLKHILDSMGVENIIVTGNIHDSYLNSENYYWNLVKVDGVYYHVDATWNIDLDGIFVGGFMKDDCFMSETHQWYQRFPSAKGTRFDYDYVEDYLVENGEELLDCGIPEHILFPEPVNDF